MKYPRFRPLLAPALHIGYAALCITPTYTMIAAHACRSPATEDFVNAALLTAQPSKRYDDIPLLPRPKLLLLLLLPLLLLLLHLYHARTATPPANGR
jgi:hypothetical protein